MIFNKKTNRKRIKTQRPQIKYLITNISSKQTKNGTQKKCRWILNDSTEKLCTTLPQMHIRRIVWWKNYDLHWNQITWNEFVQCVRYSSSSEWNPDKNNWKRPNYDWIGNIEQWEAMLLGMCWHIRFGSDI